MGVSFHTKFAEGFARACVRARAAILLSDFNGRVSILVLTVSHVSTVSADMMTRTLILLMNCRVPNTVV